MVQLCYNIDPDLCHRMVQLCYNIDPDLCHHMVQLCYNIDPDICHHIAQLCYNIDPDICHHIAQLCYNIDPDLCHLMVQLCYNIDPDLCHHMAQLCYNTDPDLCHHMAQLCHNELMERKKKETKKRVHQYSRLTCHQPLTHKGIHTWRCVLSVQGQLGWLLGIMYSKHSNVHFWKHNTNILMGINTLRLEQNVCHFGRRHFQI